MRKKSVKLYNENLSDQVKAVYPIANKDQNVIKVQLKENGSSNSINSTDAVNENNFSNDSSQTKDTQNISHDVSSAPDNHSDREKDYLLREENRTPVLFTQNEIDYLIKKEKEFGKQWTKILRMGKMENIFNKRRRYIDLKHKFDQLNKNSSYYLTPIRKWILDSIDDTPINNSFFHEMVTEKKFPFEAAENFVHRNIHDNSKKFTISLFSPELPGKYHKYLIVSSKKGDYKIKKLRNNY